MQRNKIRRQGGKTKAKKSRKELWDLYCMYRKTVKHWKWGGNYCAFLDSSVLDLQLAYLSWVVQRALGNEVQPSRLPKVVYSTSPSFWGVWFKTHLAKAFQLKANTAVVWECPNTPFLILVTVRNYTKESSAFEEQRVSEGAAQIFWVRSLRWYFNLEAAPDASLQSWKGKINITGSKGKEENVV